MHPKETICMENVSENLKTFFFFFALSRSTLQSPLFLMAQFDFRNNEEEITKYLYEDRPMVLFFSVHYTHILEDWYINL